MSRAGHPGEAASPCCSGLDYNPSKWCAVSGTSRAQTERITLLNSSYTNLTACTVCCERERVVHIGNWWRTFPHLPGASEWKRHVVGRGLGCIDRAHFRGRRQRIPVWSQALPNEPLRADREHEAIGAALVAGLAHLERQQSRRGSAETDPPPEE